MKNIEQAFLLFGLMEHLCLLHPGNTPRDRAILILFVNVAQVTTLVSDSGFNALAYGYETLNLWIFCRSNVKISINKLACKPVWYRDRASVCTVHLSFQGRFPIAQTLFVGT